MKGKNHSPEQIVRVLVEAEAQIAAGPPWRRSLLAGNS